MNRQVPLIEKYRPSRLEDLKNQEVYIYCRSGNRSGQACLILETMGFTNLTNVSGGMLAWQDRIAK
jgi:rhodanese-related sulfurtransferase